MSMDLISHSEISNKYQSNSHKTVREGYVSIAIMT